ncbi:MAG: GGDEF domain-containing protein [Lachnospiraceae bacterium]|nr:GGDEF domain-containing protein [Lachnospiraceae bacterium]
MKTISKWLKNIGNIITGRRIVSQQSKLEVVSIAITAVHVIMFFMFVQFNIWPLIIYNGIVVLYYLYVLRMVHTGNVLGGYIMTFVEIAVQVIFGTFMLGWDVGFFMYVFAIIPLFFYLNLLHENTDRSVLTPLFCSFGAIAVFVSSFTVSIYFKPAFELSGSRVNLLFLFNSLLAILLLAAMSHFFIIERRYSLITMLEQNQKLDVEANIDPLTGLVNRRSMEKHLDGAMEDARNHGAHFSLIMGDIDFFKNINDTYGHEVGDEALKAVAKIFRNSVRDRDTVCRWGGEEFLVLILGSNEEATAVAERVRERIKDNVVIHGSKEIRFTITLGVTSYVPGRSVEELIDKADSNMYFGKNNGRDQVVSKVL